VGSTESNAAGRSKRPRAAQIAGLSTVEITSDREEGWLRVCVTSLGLFYDP